MVFRLLILFLSYFITAFKRNHRWCLHFGCFALLPYFFFARPYFTAGYSKFHDSCYICQDVRLLLVLLLLLLLVPISRLMWRTTALTVRGTHFDKYISGNLSLYRLKIQFGRRWPMKCTESYGPANCVNVVNDFAYTGEEKVTIGSVREFSIACANWVS